MTGKRVVAVRLRTETVGQLRAIAKSEGRHVSDIVRQRIEAPPAATPPTIIPPTPRPGEAAYLPCERSCGRPIMVTRDQAAEIIRGGRGIHHPEDCAPTAAPPPKRGWLRRS